jgi:N-acetylglucosaminyl-diphospho-decaprenol L-rhamnosyltransferase
MIDVSVIVVTYNAGQWVERCLRAVREIPTSLSIELIVVDNASTDFTEAQLRRWAGPEAVVRLLDTNVGFGRACNLAARLSTGRDLLLLNPDAIISQGAFEALVAMRDSRPSIGIVGGRVTAPSGELDRGSCWGFQTTWSLLCFASGLSTVLPRSSVLNPEGLGSWDRDTPRRVDIVTGCLLLVSRSLWERLAGFDPDFFMYGEDADLCRRALHLGFESWVTPDAHATHALGASSTSTLRKQELLFRGKATLVRKSGGHLRVAVGLLLLQAGVGLRGLGEQLTGKDRAAWLGLWRSRRDWRNGWASAPSETLTTEAA